MLTDICFDFGYNWCTSNTYVNSKTQYWSNLIYIDSKLIRRQYNVASTGFSVRSNFIGSRGSSGDDLIIALTSTYGYMETTSIYNNMGYYNLMFYNKYVYKHYNTFDAGRSVRSRRETSMRV